MGIFDKFKAGLTKTRNLITAQLQGIKLQLGKFDEAKLEELEYSLIRSDMGAANVDEIMECLKSGMKTAGRDDAEFICQNLQQQFSKILGEKKELSLQENNLNIFLLIGVNGAGKTTSCGKLAHQYMEKGKQVMLCAADTFRAAAIEQLQVWSERAGAKLISQTIGSDPAAVVYDAISSAKARNYDLLIIDTAGRLHNKKNLMQELDKIKRVIAKEAAGARVYTLLVIDALNGQNALAQAVNFSETCPVDGLILTKLDGSGKGGVAIALAKINIAPIVFAGVGEGIDDLLTFDPQAFVKALLPEND